MTKIILVVHVVTFLLEFTSCVVKSTAELGFVDDKQTLLHNQNGYVLMTCQRKMFMRTRCMCMNAYGECELSSKDNVHQCVLSGTGHLSLQD